MKLFKRLFCKHEYKWLRNMHGDEINIISTSKKIYRSVWACEKCGKVQYKEQLEG